MVDMGRWPICLSCRRYSPTWDEDFNFTARCQAFPDGIPDAIYKEGFDNRSPYFGDQGRRWSFAPESGTAFADYERDVERGMFPHKDVVIEGGGEGGDRPEIWPSKGHPKARMTMGKHALRFVSQQRRRCGKTL